MSTLIVVGTVQSRVKQATSRLSSRLNSVDNKLVERLMMNDERKTMNDERGTFNENHKKHS